MSEHGGVAVVGKAGRILQSFSELRSVQSLRQIQATTGIPRATVHGICVSLVETGLLEVVPNRGYQLGTSLIGLGGLVIERTGLLDAAKGVAKSLLHIDGAEAHLAQLVSGWVVYLDRTANKFSLPMNTQMGSRQLAHTTDGGRAALALLDPDEAWEFVSTACQAEGRPEPDRDELDADFESIRQVGFARCDLPAVGRVSIGAAVIGHTGRPVGAVSLSAPAEMFADRLMSARLVSTMHAAKTTLQRRLPNPWA